MTKSISGIPKTEILWETIKTKGKQTYYVTSKSDRDFYFLYKLIDGRAVKMGRNKSPKDLKEKYIETEKRSDNTL